MSSVLTHIYKTMCPYPYAGFVGLQILGAVKTSLAMPPRPEAIFSFPKTNDGHPQPIGDARRSVALVPIFVVAVMGGGLIMPCTFCLRQMCFSFSGFGLWSLYCVSRSTNSMLWRGSFCLAGGGGRVKKWSGVFFGGSLVFWNPNRSR